MLIVTTDTVSVGLLFRMPTVVGLQRWPGCPPFSSIINTRWRLRFFGHVACSDYRQGHHQAVSASLRPPRDWRRPQQCPRTTWLRGIDATVQLSNISIHSAWRNANNRVLWRCIIDTAILIRGTPLKKKVHGQLM